MNTYTPAREGKHAPCANCGEGKGWHLGNELLCDRCSRKGCDANAVAWLPGYPERMPACFQHEREYVDRYGPGGVVPIGTTNIL